MRLHLFFILSLLGISGIAQTTRTWTGSTNTDWQTASNWSPSGIPLSLDPVIINSTTNQPVLGGSASIASLTVNSGVVLNLGSHSLTVSGSFTGNLATVSNGSLITGAATVTSCTFGARLTSSGATIQLRNNTFNAKVTVTQTGNSNTSSHGNTFNDPTRLTNNSAGFLSFGVGVADIFNDSLFATVTATRALYLAHSSAGNQFNGYVEFNKTSTATSTGVFVGSIANSAIFKQTVSLKSAIGLLHWPSASFSSCTFDSTSSLLVNSTNFTHGQLALLGCKIYANTTITLGTNAQLHLGSNTVAHNTFTASAGSVIFAAVEFKVHCSITKTGSSTDLSQGPMICRSSNLFKNASTGLFWLGSTSPNKFHGGLTLENSGPGTLNFTLGNAGDLIEGTTSLITSAGTLIIGVYQAIVRSTLKGDVTLNLSGGTTLINSLSQNISSSLYATNFAGNLYLSGYHQYSNTPINLSGTGGLVLNPATEIRGNFNVTASRIYIQGGQYYGNTVITQTGALSTTGGGTPIFHQNVEFACTGTGAFQINYPHTIFTYEKDLILNNVSGGLQLGYAGIHKVKGDVIYKGAYNISSWSNAIVLNGLLNQAIKREHSFTPRILRIEINKPSGIAMLETPLLIEVNLSLQKGELHTTAANFPTLGSTATITGGSDSSYVVGPISKIGTAAFTFPTGGNGSYAPLGIDAVASSCTFKANYIAEDPDSLYPRSQKDTTLGFVNRCGYWNLDRTSGTQNTKVTLGWSNSPCFAPRPVDVKLSNWNSNSWNNSGTVSYQGNSQIGKVSMLNNYSGSYPLVANLTGKCYKDVTYRINRDTLLHGLKGIVFLSPGNPKEIKLEIDNSLIYEGQDSIVSFSSFTNNSDLKLHYFEQEGCEHKFQRELFARQPEVCATSIGSDRNACTCGATEISNDNQIPQDADALLYTSKGYFPLSNDDQSVPTKRIGINLIVVQRFGSSPDNFTNSNIHTNALYDAFNFNVPWSVRNRFLNVSQPSDPPIIPNQFINSSRIEFWVDNIDFLQVSDAIFYNDYSNGANRELLKDIAKEQLGCDYYNNLNYFMVKYYAGASGRADFPECQIDFDQSIFSQRVYGDYLANGADIPGNSGGYDDWIYAFTVHAAHELGHILDLNHTYNSCQQEDQLTDFDPLEIYGIDPITGNNLSCPHEANVANMGCAVDPFINNPSDPCYRRNTNNIMGGCFLSGHYISQRQIGKIHKATSLTSLRKYVDNEKNNCPYSNVPNAISSDQTLYLDTRMYNDLIVVTGRTLTINCRVEFPDDAALVVQPGARLILAENAVLTGACTMWKGVRVMGKQNVEQGTLSNTQQGMIEMRPGSVIENAEEAVFMGNINNEMFGVAGGIITADGAIFRNNYRSIAFHQYGNLANQISNPLFNSISDIRNCHFICDAHLKNSDYFNLDGSRQGSKHFVTLWDIHGVEFTDNTFENTIEYQIVSNCSPSTYSWNEDERGTGIGTFDAQFDLISSNPSIGLRNRFINLTRGIEARVTNTSVVYNFSTDGSEFNNVKYGIFTEHGNADLIKDNDFISLNPDGSGGPEVPQSYSVYLHNYRYAEVQFNSFNGTANQLPEEWGLVTQQLNGNSSGIVSRNDFNKLGRGLQPQRDNTALKISCNEFDDNYLDWHVNPITFGDFANQGVGCGPNDYRPGNLFLDLNQFHIRSQQVIGQNGPTLPKWYYYSRGNSPNDIEIPLFDNPTILGTYESCINSGFLPNPCPNGTGARMSNNLQAIRLGIESEIDFLESSIVLLEDSLDNQQTDSLLAIIVDTSASITDVHAKLYNSSPLSDTVMISFLKRDSISNVQLISLLSFNLPGSMRLMDSLYSYSLTHTIDSIAWDTIQKLQAFNPNIESIKQIERNIEFYKGEWKRVVGKTEKALIDEMKLDDLISFYKDTLGLGYEKETFGAYLASGDFSTARNWLQNNLPQNNSNDSAFVTYHSLHLDLMEDSISWLQLNGSQLSQVKLLGLKSSEIQRLALAVLALRGDTILNELPEFSNSPISRISGESKSSNNINHSNNKSLSVYPNPSDGLFIIRLTNEIEVLNISVVDVTGRNVFQYNYRETLQEKSINLSHLSNGVYYVNCTSNGQYIGSAPIVIYK